jgi:hypothetical protein
MYEFVYEGYGSCNILLPESKYLYETETYSKKITVSFY